MASVVFVAGARPNFMKVAPMLRALARRPRRFADVLVHTGQHYDFEMSGVFFEQLGIREPDVHLQVGSAPHGAQTGRIMAEFEGFLLARNDRPRGIVVVGDVNSTMACALVGAKLGIPVAHVEAGLRSFDRAMPEEINRVVTDAVADLLLVSEPAGTQNLLAEGVTPDRLRYVGNVMIDSLVAQLPAARELAVASGQRFARGEYALVTLHRPSNVDEPTRLAMLVDVLGRLATRLPVVFPVHPRTHARLVETGLLARLDANPAIQLGPALGYREFLGLMEAARVVLSDSGGIQEETTYLGIPCITLRSTTERPVTVSHGTNTLVGDDLELALATVDRVIAGGASEPLPPIPGWDGMAAERVLDALIEAWGDAPR